MIRYLYGTQLEDHGALAGAMFRDRAARPCGLTGAQAHVDALGWETDACDMFDPLYVIACDGAGGHAGSLRLLPTVGSPAQSPAAVHLAPRRIYSPDIWEVSRPCLSRRAARGTAGRLMLAVSELGLGLGLKGCIGALDPAVLRGLRRAGWAGQIMARGVGVMVGQWTFSVETHDRLCEATGIPARQSRNWWEVTFGDLSTVPLPVAV